MPEDEEWPPNEEERNLLFKSISQASSHLVGRAWDYVWKFTGIHRSNPAGGWSASVQGTRLYSVTVALDGNDLCTCPYFSEHLDCKHLIALRLRLFEEGDILELPGSDVEPPPALTPQVESGLQILRKIAATLNTSQEDASSRIREVAFVLMLTDTRRRIRFAEIVPRPRVFTKRDGWSLDRADLRHTILHTQFPPKYISPDDMRLIEGCGDPPADYGWRTRRPPAGLHMLLAAAARLKRLFLADGTSLELDEGLWKFEPSLELGEDGSGHFIVSLHSLEDARVHIPQEPWCIAGTQGNRTVLEGSHLYRIDSRVPEELLLLSEDLPVLPGNALAQVRQELRQLSRSGVVVPESCFPPPLHEAPLRCARVELSDSGDVYLSVVAAYPSLMIPPDIDDDRLAFTDENGLLVELERDREAEALLRREFLDLLREAEVEPMKVDGRWMLQDAVSLRKLALRGVPRLQEAGWKVGDVALLERWRRRSGTFRAAARSSGQDWFELSGALDFDGMEIPLSTLVAHAGPIVLPDGSTGEVSEALLKRLHWLERLGTPSEGGIRLRGFHAVLAQELMESGLAQARDPLEWRQQLEHASVAGQEEPASIPASLQASLRPYQAEGFRWLMSLRRQGIGGILADDMGLGKTIQVIALLCRVFEDDPKAAPALVVAPASVAGNWISELERFAPHLRSRLLHGIGREALRDAPVEAPTIFVTTYGILPREQEWLDGREFSIAVLDESQSIRNSETVTHRCCQRLRAVQRLCLTGTPIENALSDLWAQFAFLNPGLLGPREEFLSQFSPEPGETPDLSRLRLVTAPFWMRRTKAAVARDLPPREDIQLLVELDPRQQALYQRQLKEYQKSLLPTIRRQGLDHGARFQVLTAILRLRQIACAPELAGYRGPSAKLDTLVEKLCQDIAEGHRALVFSSFTSLLDLVELRLSRENFGFLRIDGSTPAATRTRQIRRFQDGGPEAIFLVSLKAGGAGINLTAADDVFLLDPWWNPAAEEQAVSRAHRIGQTRPVTLYRMIAKGTIEERVLALARGKAALARELFDSGDTGGAMLTSELVQELLG